MGREIRRVPPNWQHPMRTCKHGGVFGIPRGCTVSRLFNGKCFIPLMDNDIEGATQEWNDELVKYQAEHPGCTVAEFCEEWGDRPDPERYHPVWGDTATWYQLYETVSEGTPVSPPFATKEELIEFLVTVGPYTDVPWSRMAAEQFVNELGWSPSLSVIVPAVVDDDHPIQIYKPGDYLPPELFNKE